MTAIVAHDTSMLAAIGLRTTLLFLTFLLASCVATVIPAGPNRTAPVVQGESLRVRDAAALPLHRWLPVGSEPTSVIVALHGFNDYGSFFAKPGSWLAERGIASYSYDQRGFGRAPNRGIWPGEKTLVQDLRDAVSAVRTRHPGVPLFVLGESMGAAVAIVAATTPDSMLEPDAAGRQDGAHSDVDGLILAAPAVWGRATMPWYQTAALWVSAQVAPGWTVTGRGLRVVPSNNTDMLRALGRDPLVIKETRVDTLRGLVDLMDASQAAAPRLGGPMLLLVGGRDQLVPEGAIRHFLALLGYDDRGERRVAVYPDGYHMLLRDLEAETVWADIAAWIADPAAPLPSGAAPPALSRRPAVSPTPATKNR